MSFSPERLGRDPSHWSVTSVPSATPERPAYHRRARLAATLTLTGLTIIALILLTPKEGFALVEWFAIFLAVGVIAVYLRGQYARAETRRAAELAR